MKIFSSLLYKTMDNQQQIQIKAKDEDLKGIYSNLMQILHTKEEFILDFLLNGFTAHVGLAQSDYEPGTYQKND